MILAAAILVGHVAGRRFGIAPPVLLLVTGVPLGFIPAVRGAAQLPPEVVLLPTTGRLADQQRQQLVQLLEPVLTPPLPLA